MAAPTDALPTLHKLLQKISMQKRVDLSVGVQITSLANCRVRDINGNLLSSVWTRRTVNNECDTQTLLTREVLQGHLETFLNSNIQAQAQLLARTPNPQKLVQWLVNITDQWERRYAQQRDEKFDISHAVESAMSQVVIEHALPYLKHYFSFQKVVDKLEEKMKALKQNPCSNMWIRALLVHASRDRATAADQHDEMFFWLFRRNHALTRLLFRINTSTELRERLCLLAAKMYQKKEVCERQGVYASVRQRTDVVQNYNNTVLAFRDFVANAPRDTLVKEALELFESDDWIFLVIDHTAVPVSMQDIPPAEFRQDAESASWTTSGVLSETERDEGYFKRQRTSQFME